MLTDNRNLTSTWAIETGHQTILFAHGYLNRLGLKGSHYITHFLKEKLINQSIYSILRTVKLPVLPCLNFT